MVVFADEANSNDSTIGTASAAEMAEYVARKNALIEEYYKQKVAGDPEAVNTLNELNAYSTRFAAEHGDATAQKNLTANIANASDVSRATSNSLNVTWIGQLNDYYCGPATAEMIIEYVKGNVTSQNTLAGSSYLRTNSLGQTPWSIGDGSSSSHYLMAVTLNSFSLGLTYIPRPWPVTGSTLTTNNLKSSVVASIDGNDNIALDSYTQTTYSGTTYKLHFGYNFSSGHWTVICGYSSSGTTLYIADPYGTFNGNSIPKKYNVSASNVYYLTNRGTGGKGIIY